MKFDWFKYLKRGYCKSVEFHWLLQWKLTDFTVKNIFFSDESVKGRITDLIIENLTDLDSERKQLTAQLNKRLADVIWFLLFVCYIETKYLKVSETVGDQNFSFITWTSIEKRSYPSNPR